MMLELSSFPTLGTRRFRSHVLANQSNQDRSQPRVNVVKGCNHLSCFGLDIQDEADQVIIILILGGQLQASLFYVSE
jgi:hypothetical protein